MIPSSLAVVLYRVALDGAGRIPEVYPRHRARLDAFAADTGDLLLIGPFSDRGDPAAFGSMAVFRTRAAAEAFVRQDPLVVQGVVGEVEIRDWSALDFTDASAG